VSDPKSAFPKIALTPVFGDVFAVTVTRGVATEGSRGCPTSRLDFPVTKVAGSVGVRFATNAAVISSIQAESGAPGNCGEMAVVISDFPLISEASAGEGSGEAGEAGGLDFPGVVGEGRGELTRSMV
jgi:hypothetical protein